MSDVPGASPPRLRAFASAPNSPRQRRSTDIALLVGSALILLAILLIGDVPTDADSALISALQSLNSLIGLIWSISYLALLLWAVALLVLTLVRKGRRGLTLSALAAAALASAIAMLVALLMHLPLSSLWHSLVSTDPNPSAIAMRVAVTSAVVLAIAPELTHMMRRVGTVIIAAGAISSVALGLSYPTGALAGIVIGTFGAAVVRLVRGSTGGLLTSEQIVWGLAELSFPISDVDSATVDLPGVQVVSALTSAGSPCMVKVYGRDAQQADAVESLWTAVRRRGERPAFARSRTEAVEHEAMVTLLAERAGVPVLNVLTAGVSAGGDGLLVLQGPQRALDQLDSAAVTDEVIAQILRSVKSLHAAGMAHGDITARCFVMKADGSWAISNLQDATVGLDDDDAAIDIARLLVVAALAVGIDRAARLAVQELNSSTLTSALPYLQSIVLDRSQRGALKGSQLSTSDLASALADGLGTEAPKPIELRRITPSRIVWSLLGIALAAMLIGAVAQVNWQEVVHAFVGANYAVLVGALVVSLCVQPFWAIAEMASVTVRLKFFPMLMVEYAIGFVQLVVPASGARVALLARFFQKFGLAPGRSVTASLIASFVGLLVQATLLILIFLLPVPGFTTSPTTSSSTSSADSTTTESSWSLAGLIAIVVSVFIVGLLAALVIPKTRARVTERFHRTVEIVRAQAREVRSALNVLRRPSNVLRMIGGNLGAQLVQAAVLGLCVKAFGFDATWSQLILVNTAAALLNGLAPVPGGIGVVEACLTLGLTAIGIPSSTALSIALVFRAITFYLPPIWGAGAMRWLRKGGYI